MTKPYPNHDFLNGNYAPLRMECDLNDLVVEGEIPKEIFGSYYRKCYQSKKGPYPQQLVKDE